MEEEESKKVTFVFLGKKSIERRFDRKVGMHFIETKIVFEIFLYRSRGSNQQPLDMCNGEGRKEVFTMSRPMYGSHSP